MTGIESLKRKPQIHGTVIWGESQHRTGDCTGRRTGHAGCGPEGHSRRLAYAH